MYRAKGKVVVTDGGLCSAGSEGCRLQEKRCKWLVCLCKTQTCFKTKGTLGLQGEGKAGSPKADSQNTQYTSPLSKSVAYHKLDPVPFFFFLIEFCKGNECSLPTPLIWKEHLVFFICISFPLWLSFSNWALWLQSLECRNELLSFAFSWGGVAPDGNVIMLKCINRRHCARRRTADRVYVSCKTL